MPERAHSLVFEAVASGQLGGGSTQGVWCEAHLRAKTGSPEVLLTNSASSALDAACSLIGLGPGDEAILPSFTFPSAANAVVRCGAVPVFADIGLPDLNLDPESVARAITSRTKALILGHYAGKACDLSAFQALAQDRGIAIIEDAAHAYDATHDGRQLGTFGRFGAYSFQQTKNLSCGEGGALIVADPGDCDRARAFRDKGTNRWQLAAGRVRFYEWVDCGAGIAPGEIAAAFLRAQLESAAAIKSVRLKLHARYARRLAGLAMRHGLRLPSIPEGCDHNGHIFFVLATSASERDRLISFLGEREISASFHYMPLHSSPAGRRFGRVSEGGCPVTGKVAQTIVRLPLFHDLGEDGVDRVCAGIEAYFN
jgi:dTDP-4-amino-4,6-dideoxygalactose transaminase